MTKKTYRKKYITILFCVVILINLALPVWAATGVPQAVLNAVDSVVYIENRKGSGTGFVIKNENGEMLIATNNHVAGVDPEGNYVWLTAEKKEKAEIVFAVPEKDLSVICIRGTINKKPAMLAEDDAERGDAVYAVGFPGTADKLSAERLLTSDAATITDGIVGGVRSEASGATGLESVKILQINAAINPGNSGGPLFDVNGHVVGINTMTLRNFLKQGEDGAYEVDVAQGTNLAVAVSELLSLLKEYGINIPAPVKPETTEPPVQETTAPAVSETMEPAPDPTEVTAPPEKPKETVWEPGMILVICVAAVVGAVALSMILTEKKKKHVMKKKRKPTSEKGPVDEYIVKPKISDEIVIDMTPSRKKKESEEKELSSEDYFKGIKL